MTEAIPTVQYVIDALLGLLIGIVGFFGSRLFKQVDGNTKTNEQLAVRQSTLEQSCKDCSKSLFKIDDLRVVIREEMESALVKLELQWIKEGRLSAKKNKDQTNG
jgi:hypothetical protein